VRTENHRVEARPRDPAHRQSCTVSDRCPALANFDLAYEYSSRIGGKKTNRTPACRVHAMEWAQRHKVAMPAASREVSVA